MADLPAIVLVHGFWGGAAHWTNVIKELARQNVRNVSAVELPLTSLADDAARTARMIAQQNGPVLLVGHSYGGAVITQAGEAPNVAGLVYVAAFAPDVGESPGGISQAKPPAAFSNIAPDSDGYLWVKKELFHDSFCQDLSPEDAWVMGVTQKAPLGSTFGDAATVAAWKTRPSWYQVSENDRMIHPDNQRSMAGRMKARKTISLDASHASLASRPAEITALILEAARSVSA